MISRLRNLSDVLNQLCQYIQNEERNQFEDETNGDADSSTSIEENSSDEEVKKYENYTNHGRVDSYTSSEENSEGEADNYEFI